MINVVRKTCLNEWCKTIISNPKYKGYCLYCFINKFPDEPNLRNYKTKEFSVVEYVKNEFPNLSWIADKKIEDGCSIRRPDLMLDLGFQVLIIEIDENQHKSYEKSCENKRLMQISQDLGHRSIIFIRFNPDGYINNNNKITSCWGIDGYGILNIKKNKKQEWENRLINLKEQIKYYMENTTNKTIEIVNLFYDI